MINSKDKLVKWAIVLFLMFGFGFLPAFGSMTPEGMKILGIFVGAVFGWSTLSVLEVTICAMVAYGLVVGFNTFVASSFGSPMIAMMMVFFPVCGMLNKYGVLQVLAQKFITMKFCERKPWRICFVLFLTAAICAPINGPVIAILMMAFATNICKTANINTPSPQSVAMAIGIALGCMCGQLFIPVFGTPLVLIGALTAITGVTVNLAKYMLLIIPCGILMLLVYTACMKYILKIDVSALECVTAETLGGRVKFSKDQTKALAVTGLLLFFMVANSIFPAGSLPYTILSKFGMFGIPITGVMLMMFLRNEAGEPLFSFAQFARDGFAWEPFFLAAFIVPFATYMTGGTTGIPQTITSLMGPLMGLSPIAFLVLALAFVCIVTNFAQNTVVVIMCLPFFMAYGASSGFAMDGMYILMFLVAQIAILSPGSSTIDGIIYSIKDMVDVGMVSKMAVKALPVLFIVLMAVGFPLTLLLW